MKRFGWFFVLFAVLFGAVPFAASKSVADSGGVYITVMLADGVCQMDIEEYTLRVLIAEGRGCENAETRKALAVAVRSCGMYFTLYGMKHEKFNACADKNCCLPLGDLKKAEGEYISELTSAVNETKGIILTLDKLPAMALFTRCAHSGTRYCKEFEYITPVENREKCEQHVTELEFTREEYFEILGTEPESEHCIVYCENQKCEFGVFGNKMLTADEIVRAFSLPSYEFSLDVGENGVKFTCFGMGHCAGFDICAANKLADNGYDYEKLIYTYFPNLKINKIYNS